MPRDGSGNYTLPAGNPVVTGTTVTSAWANTTMSDVAVQMNNVLTRDGLLGPVAAFKLVDGAVATPGLSFNSEAGLGLYRIGSNILGVATQNATPVVLDSSNGSAEVLRLMPRLTSGSPQASLVLSNQPYNTANRVDATLALTQTALTLVTTGVGTGVELPIQVNSPFQMLDGAAVTGNQSITGKLSISSTGANDSLSITDSSQPHIKMVQGANNSYLRLNSGTLEWVNSAYSAVIASLTNAGVFTAVNVGIFSDERRKENIVRALGALSRVLKLQAVTYNLAGQEGVERGFVAQQLQEVYPELVYEDSEGFLAVKYLGLISELAQAIIELCVYTGVNPDPVEA